jgi:hypothetical protein
VDFDRKVSAISRSRISSIALRGRTIADAVELSMEKVCHSGIEDTQKPISCDLAQAYHAPQ